MYDPKKVWAKPDFPETPKWINYKCPICSTIKGICMKEEYVYRIKHKYYCSYTCWTKALKKEERSHKKQKRNFTTY